MTASKCFMFMYFLQPHWVPATWRSRAQTSIRAEFPSGNAPTTLVLRRISRFSRSITLLVRMRVQCSLGKTPYWCPKYICRRAFTFWIAPRCSICSPDEKISSPRSMALICFITDSGIPTPLSSIIKWSSACEKNTLSVTVPGPRFGSSPWNTAFSIIVIFYARHFS